MKIENIKERNPIVDVVKGIAIIMVVGGHTVWDAMDKPETSFIYLFHMALFYVASGYTYKNKYEESFKTVVTFIKKRIKKLYIPYVVWGIVFVLLHNFFLNVNVYTENSQILNYTNGIYGAKSVYTVGEIIFNCIKTLFMANTEQIAGAFWFIQSLLVLEVLYCLVGFCGSKIGAYFNRPQLRHYTQIMISLITMLIGFFLYKANVNVLSIGTTFSAYILFCFGEFFGHDFKKLETKLNPNRSFWLMLSVLILMCVYISPIHISLNANIIVNPLVYVLVSLSGWFLVYILACWINERLTIISKFLQYLGKHTLYVVIFHFLGFKLINYVYMRIFELPSFTTAAFPVLTENGLWRIVYIIFGIAIPLAIEKGVYFIKKCLPARKEGV